MQKLLEKGKARKVCSGRGRGPSRGCPPAAAVGKSLCDGRLESRVDYAAAFAGMSCGRHCWSTFRGTVQTKSHCLSNHLKAERIGSSMRQSFA